MIPTWTSNNRRRARKENFIEAVRILTDGKVKNGHRTVKVKKSLGEAISFIVKGNGGSWKVVFDKGDGNPFTPATINIPKGSFESSGPPTSGVVGKSYRYSV
jgi:hypothetical protein